MKIKQSFIWTAAVIVLISRSVFAQFGDMELDIMEQHYKNFDYEQALTVSDQVLVHKTDLNPDQLVRLYSLRAFCNYSLLQMNLALVDFVEILKIDPDFTLDTVTTSPKIVTFFNEIKTNLNIPQKSQPIREISSDTVKVVFDNSGFIRNMLVRSAILPGWGHLYYQNLQKGWFLSTLGLVSMVGSVYYSIECHTAQKSYLNENNPDKIESQYSEYNSAYKNRTYFITAYALVWLYSQSDILFTLGKKTTSRVSISLAPVPQSMQLPGICCTLYF